MSKNTLLKDIFTCFCAVIVSTAIFFLVYPHFELHIPLNYTYDNLFVSSAIKGVLDNGWFLTNPYLGAPGIQSLAEYPVSESAHFLLIKWIGLFTNEYAVAENVFYILTFSLTTLFAYPVFRVFKLSTINSFVASIVFAYIPFHLLRGESHLFLSALYAVPPCIYLMLSIYRPETRFTSKLLHNLCIFILCIFVASCGIYYAFFGSFFILLTGLIAYFEARDKSRLLKAGLFIAVITLTVVVNIFPSVIANHALGLNKVAAYRAAYDSETFGLKIVQMVLPVDNHRLPGFRKSKAHYNAISKVVNENTTVSLGILGSLGFFALLFLLIIPAEKTELFLLSKLNIFAILLGTMGGLGAVFAYRISPMIRAYNRISVFIAFFALCAFFLILQKITVKRSKLIACLIAALCLVTGLFDQIPIIENNHQQIKQAFLNDKALVEKIESSLPSGSRIFQLPYMEFPEVPDIYAMRDYDPYRFYLHSHTLKWSYGSIKGRGLSNTQKRLNHLAPIIIVESLQREGFAGLVIDTFGYADKGNKIKSDLNAIFKKPSLESSDKRFIFYSF